MYDELDLKVPIELDDYFECSSFVISAIEKILENAMKDRRNQILINTNLRFGLPMENINKIAGPWVK